MSKSRKCFLFLMCVAAFSQIAFGINDDRVSPTGTDGEHIYVTKHDKLDTNPSVIQKISDQNSSSRNSLTIDNVGNKVEGRWNVAIGMKNVTKDVFSSAFGYHNFATKWSSSAFGQWNEAIGEFSSAFGYWNKASGKYNSSAFGMGNEASASQASAFGYWNFATEKYASAFGSRNEAKGEKSTAIGFENEAHKNATSIGYKNLARGGNNAIGDSNIVKGIKSTAIGSYNKIDGPESPATINKGEYNFILGSSNKIGIHANNNFILGNRVTIAEGISRAVVLGSDSTAVNNAVSVGSATEKRRIVNVADGTQDTDAATVGQVRNLIASSTGITSGNESINAYTKGESDNKFAAKGDIEKVKTEKLDISVYNSDKTTINTTLQNKADKDAANLSANDVKAWRDKLGVISNTAIDSKSTSIGNSNKVTGSSSTAVGYKNEVSGNKSGAFGDPNIVTGNSSYAFGNDNTIAGNDNFVLGSNVNIGAGISNSVALGNNSTVKASNEVSVGSTGNERKITNVADGELSSTSTDAVTGKQLFDVMQNSGTTGIKNLRNEINKKLDDTRDEMRGIGALSASLSALHPMQYDPKAPNQIMAGVGTYKNKQAVAVGMSHYFKENVMMTAGIALSNERKTNAMANLGVTWKIGKGGETSAEIPQSVIQNEMARLARENQEQKAENRELKARVQKLEETLNKLLNK